VTHVARPLGTRGSVSVSLLALLAAFAVTGAAAVAQADEADDFEYLPPGDLIPGSGTGRADDTVFVPGMRYPVESAPSFPNSQVYMNGGGLGPGGGQCDAVNFSYPWRDNYCESRSWDMPLCPSGTGHQGQDIRGATCDKSVHWVVAAADGVVTSIGSYSLYITDADGTRYDYLHTDSLQVSEGDTVTRGQRLSKISNEFGGTPTTVHLHFNLRQTVDGVGTVYVPPYTSLVESYRALIGPAVEPLQGSLDEVSCDGIRGWTAAPEALETPIEARLYFDGGPGGDAVVGHPVIADRDRPDLCDSVGCEHGFETGLPLSLLDSTAHAVRAFGSRGTPSDQLELQNSPSSFTCALEIPDGVRRAVPDASAETSWRFSSFWDVAEVSQGILDTITASNDLPAAPRVVATDAVPEDLWLIDGDVRRRVPDAIVAAAWDFYPEQAERIDAATLEAIPEGPTVRPRPFVLRGPSGAFLIDAPSDEPPSGTGGGTPGSGGASASDGDGDGDDGDGDGTGDEDDGSVGSGAGGDAAEDAGGGCNCRVGAGESATRSSGALVFLVGAAGLAFRARRRRA